MTAQAIVATAISTSVHENRTVHLECTAEVAREIMCQSDDDCDGTDGDYWGTTDAGHEWRVRLVSQEER